MEERISAVSKSPEECWLWAWALDPKGYGVISLTNRRAMAHRVVFEHIRGPIPDGMVLDHLCRNHGCVNPAHLEPVTNRENLIRGVGTVAINAAKTHCVRGHELTPENVRIRVNRGRPSRACIACIKARRREPASLEAKRLANARWRAKHGSAYNAVRRGRRREA